MFERSDSLKKLIEQLDSSDTRLQIGTSLNDSVLGDEIFHAPAISFCILIISSIKSFELRVSETGKYVAVTLQEAVTGLKRSDNDLRWSFRLRSVCAEALGFLELNEMITVSEEKVVRISEKGADFLKRSFKEESDLLLFRNGIVRGFDRARIRGESFQ